MKKQAAVFGGKNKKAVSGLGVVLSFLLVFNILVCNMPSDFEAAENESTVISLIQDGDMFYASEEYEETAHNLQNVKMGVSLLSTESTVEETIYKGLSNLSSSINISQYRISEDTLSGIMQDIVNCSPEFFYVDSRYSYNYTYGNDYIDELKPKYNDTASNIQTQKATYENEMNKIIANVDSDWSDLEKIVFVHDYLAQNYEYDTDLKIKDAYNFLTQKKGVCQAYTLVFCGLMQKLGIDVSYASSSSMNHIWNVVKLNGNWYHVDNTWDDPVSDRLGLAYHNNLLLSDTGIQNTEHNSWTSYYTCTLTEYDNYYWKEITSPFKYASGLWYYTKYDSSDAGLYKGDINGNAQKVLSLGKWYVANSSSSYYPGVYSGLHIRSGNVLYNDMDKVYAYNVSSGKTEVVYEPESDKRIWGFNVSGNVLSYALADDGNGSNKEILTYKLSSESSSDNTAAPTNTTPISATPVKTTPPTNTTAGKTTTPPTNTTAGKTTPSPANTTAGKTTTSPANTTAVSKTTPPTNTTAGKTTPSPANTTAVSKTTPPTNKTAVSKTTPPANTTPVSKTTPPANTTAGKTTISPANTTAVSKTTPPANTTAVKTTPPANTTPSGSTSLIKDNTRKMGDANKDGKVDLKDAKLVLTYSLGINKVNNDEVEYLDFNNNKKIDLSDAKETLKISLGISSFIKK